MTPSIRAFGGIVLAASLVGFSSLAIAQTQGGPPPPPSAEQRQAWMQHRQEHMQEMMDAHAKRLHDILNLRPDQDAALKTMLTTMKPMHDHDGMKNGGMKLEGRDGPEGMARLTTPERLDKMAARMAEHQAAFQQHAAAIKQFYAVLSPEQQRAFDALPGMMGGEHQMGPEGMEHHHMGPGGPGEHGGPGGPQ